MRSEIPKDETQKVPCCCCPSTYLGMDIGWVPQEVRRAGWTPSSPLSFIRSDIQRGCSLLNLGCGAGLDVFIAARLTGPDGLAIGVDTAPEKLSIARNHVGQVSESLGYPGVNIDLHETPLEEIPLEDETIDIVLSNCAINLSEDKQKVYDEIFRVLRPGGRAVISDIFSISELPNYIKRNEALVDDRLNTAEPIKDVLETVKKSGLRGIALLEGALKAQVDLWELFSVAMIAYKPSIPEQNGTKYATLIGPCSQAEDEMDNVYVRGKPTKVSMETATVLELPTYRDYFFVSNDPIELKESSALSIVPKPSPCLFAGDYVILFGPFTKIHDDGKHVFYAGHEREICQETSNVLSFPLYNKLFVRVNRCRGRLDPKETCCESDGS